ncbi:UNVERIFIED_CONTAM: hypothetical protein ITH36_25305, partial [Salmonella enterica subsp. enterica serovar Weltevreden]
FEMEEELGDKLASRDGKRKRTPVNKVIIEEKKLAGHLEFGSRDLQQKLVVEQNRKRAAPYKFHTETLKELGLYNEVRSLLGNIG